MLVMDAFSGDSVPVHLITKEAFATYFRHLKPNGILAVNVSNTYLDLEPVMERAANAFHKVGLLYHWSPEDDDTFCFSCSWTLIMDASTANAHPELFKNATFLTQKRAFRIWTDEFSNMLSILKYGTRAGVVAGLVCCPGEVGPDGPINTTDVEARLNRALDRLVALL